MWWYILGIIIELGSLAFLSQKFIQATFITLVRIFRSRPIAITIITIVLFPGTVIHELSHLFTAEILGVRTGTLTLTPESLDTHDIRSGSVQIAKTDPFRRTAIGIAPTIVGISAVSALSYWLIQVLGEQTLLTASGYSQWLLVIGILYLISAISNTMFSSKEDLNGVLPVAILLSLIIGALYLTGLRFMPPPAVETKILSFIWSLFQNLGIVITVNLIILVIHTVLIRILTKLHR